MASGATGSRQQRAINSAPFVALGERNYSGVCYRQGGRDWTALCVQQRPQDLSLIPPRQPAREASAMGRFSFLAWVTGGCPLGREIQSRHAVIARGETRITLKLSGRPGVQLQAEASGFVTAGGGTNTDASPVLGERSWSRKRVITGLSEADAFPTITPCRFFRVGSARTKWSPM